LACVFELLTFSSEKAARNNSIAAGREDRKDFPAFWILGCFKQILSALRVGTLFEGWGYLGDESKLAGEGRAAGEG
jgi:hypothetical protein